MTSRLLGQFKIHIALECNIIIADNEYNSSRPTTGELPLLKHCILQVGWCPEDKSRHYSHRWRMDQMVLRKNRRKCADLGSVRKADNVPLNYKVENTSGDSIAHGITIPAFMTLNIRTKLILKEKHGDLRCASVDIPPGISASFESLLLVSPDSRENPATSKEIFTCWYVQFSGRKSLLVCSNWRLKWGSLCRRFTHHGGE